MSSSSVQRVAVVGASRTGKSWLVKALKGDHNGAVFLVGHTYQPTVGVQSAMCPALGPAVIVWDIGGASQEAEAGGDIGGGGPSLSDAHVDRAAALVVVFDPRR